MFIYGEYCYKKSLQKFYAFNLQEMLQIFQIIQKHIDTKKKGYFVGYLLYESAILLQSSIAFPSHVSENYATMPFVYFEFFKKRKKIKKSFFKKCNKPLFRKKQGVDSLNYAKHFACIKENIACGHTYQVNYTQELQLQPNSQYSPKKYFRILAHLQNTKYKAFLFNEFLHILSFSPELFFKIQGNSITTQPMKGTMKRGYKNMMPALCPQLLKKKSKSVHVDKTKDKKNKVLLQQDIKNRSENVMIVDLLRNDLSKIAKKVDVKELFMIQTYPTLHQMVSTIKAQLHKHYRIFDIFQALFPCGSITGAPKLKTMQIIAALEQRERSIYCGAIGVISHKKTTFSVPIRTLWKYNHEDFYRYGVGSGIVWDSLVSDELQELELKSQFLF